MTRATHAAPTLEMGLMLDVAISQVTTPRWDLPEELTQLAEHGFTSLALWRPKVSDTGATAAAAALAAADVRASSLNGAGGFTGGDGRSFAESVADGIEAVEAAAGFAAASRAVRPPVVVIHSGSRGGHTRAHAFRLLNDALTTLAPVARREGVGLALQPLRPAAVPGCSFVATLHDALDVIATCADPAVGLALDLWHFGDDPGLPALLPRLAAAAFVVQVADRCGPPTPAADRLPAGHGTLPLGPLVAGLVRHGYHGTFEVDPVGETVEVLGYGGVLRETRLVAAAWAAGMAADAASGAAARPVPVPAGGGGTRPGHFRRAGAGAGSRRSQASSQTVSPG